MNLELPPPSAPTLAQDEPKPEYVVGIPSRPQPKAEKAESNQTTSHTESLAGILLDSMAYPVRRDGWLILIPGAMAGGLLSLANFSPILGWALFVSTGYFSAYFIKALNATISGSDEPPEWPEVTDILNDIVVPDMQLAGVTLISAAPWLIYQLLVPDSTDLGANLLLLLVGAAYWPMALFSLTFHGTMRSLMPDYVLPAIGRCLPSYALVVLAAAPLFFAEYVFGTILRVPLIGPLCFSLPGFYLLIAKARFMGLIYRRYEGQFGW